LPTSIDSIVALAVSAYLVVVALLAGSFINLASDRLPRGESVVSPRSHCRTCGRVLNLVDLIPVVGYLIRRGRCASCRAQIGASSPAVEAVCGTAMLASVTWLGTWPGALVGFAAVAMGGAVAVSIGFGRLPRATR
jgi:prepilin signal peptidase PulO-like enzyme (type II secretory pathway)